MLAWTGLFDGLRQLGNLYFTSKGATPQQYTDKPYQQIQQNYHNKFLRVIPASKLWEVLQAEDRFFRMKLRSWGGAMQGAGNGNNLQRFGGGPNGNNRFGGGAHGNHRFGGGNRPQRQNNGK